MSEAGGGATVADRSRPRVGEITREADRVARVVSRRPLFYAAGADPALDRPAHVRAGSAATRIGDGRLAIVQDDASFVAIVDVVSGDVTAIPLPAADGIRQFDALRGNKKRKLDLEGAVYIEGADVLLAFGSGSSDARERIAIVTGITSGGVAGATSATLFDAGELYELLRETPAFRGSELNVEGAAIDGTDLVLFQRGNGAPYAGDKPVDATARLPLVPFLAYVNDRGPCPALRDVVQWSLGTVLAPSGRTVRLTFTDGATRADGVLAFLACAEDCPDVINDGPVAHVALGALDDRTRTGTLRPIVDERGEPLLDKAEGLSLAPDGRHAWLVVDRDDPAVASELLYVTL